MMFRYIFTITILFSICFTSVIASGVADASYLGLRDYTYGLLEDGEVDEEEFIKLVVDQGYKYRFVDWIGDAYHSVFFNNPKGSEVLYNDFVMALCIGYDRLGKPEELKKPLTRIIDRRLRMWHGTKNSNHYAREYASLASLAYLLEDERFSNLQEKLRKSVDKIYLPDGYAYEGPEYGLYAMSILSGYVYFTKDEDVKQSLINNINYLASISSQDRYKPPFDDSLASVLPSKISAFQEVNDYWRANFKFNNIPDSNTYNKQETIWRYGDTTVWIRHRLRDKEWQGLHRNYSNGDVLLKTNDTWWLVAPGYVGWDAKSVKPEFHNVAMTKWSYFWRSLWRVFGGQAELLKREESGVNKAVIKLAGNIVRTVESDSSSLVVADKGKRNYLQFWQINGTLIDQKIDGDIITLKWQQGDKILTQALSGVYKVSIENGFHTGESKTEIIEHSRLRLEGQDIISRFVW
ncbi:MAG: hypothetical protein ACKKL6_03650 [Candidatus Komeilibacteria bacterium]